MTIFFIVVISDIIYSNCCQSISLPQEERLRIGVIKTILHSLTFRGVKLNIIINFADGITNSNFTKIF